MIKFVELTEYPEWLKEAMSHKEFANNLQSNLAIVELLEKRYPPNVDTIKNVQVKDVVKNKGYCRAREDTSEIYVNSEQIENYLISYKFFEVDETRPWTLIKNEHPQLMYLDRFKLVDKENNYYEI